MWKQTLVMLLPGVLHLNSPFNRNKICSLTIRWIRDHIQVHQWTMFLISHQFKTFKCNSKIPKVWMEIQASSQIINRIWISCLPICKTCQTCKTSLIYQIWCLCKIILTIPTYQIWWTWLVWVIQIWICLMRKIFQ